MSPPRQLPLDLPHEPAFSREDFLVGPDNADAVAAVDAWPDWPDSGLLLVGPARSGKSHLVEAWRARSGAPVVRAADLPRVDAAGLTAAHDAVAVEDCGPGVDETALFHLLNTIHAAGQHVLIAARRAPVGWELGLPDLVSRLRRMPVVALSAPDDALVEAVLVKLFADRQLQVDAHVVRFLARRLERSYSALGEAVARLDRLAIEERRPVTRALAARVVDDPENVKESSHGRDNVR